MEQLMDKFKAVARFLKTIQAENSKLLGMDEESKSGLLYEIRKLHAQKKIDDEEQAKLMGPINRYLDWFCTIEHGLIFLECFDE